MFKKINEIIADKNTHIKLVKRIILENPSLLKNGSYYYSRYPRPHFKQKDKKTKLFINNMFADFFPKNSNYQSFKVYLKKFIDSFLISRFTVFSNNNSNEDLNFNGTMIMPLNRNLEVKVFNFSDERVLTYFSNETNIILQAEVIENMPNDINITVSKVDVENQIIIEKIIWPVPFEKLNSKILIKVFDKYNEDLLKSIMNMNHNSFNSYLTYDLVKHYKQYIFNNELIEVVETSMNLNALMENFEILKTFDFKSDLKFKNILITNQDYYLIDFQSSQEISILSVFFAHKRDLMLNYDFGELISRYKIGKMDYLFKELFKKFKLNYDEKLRLEYFFISLLSPIVMRSKKFTKTQLSNINKNILQNLNSFTNL